LRVALKLNPGYGITYQRLAVTATVHRRFDEADALLRQAQILDPTNWMLTYSRGENAYYAGRYDEAMAQAGKIREAAPGGACNLMERVYFRRGMLREARAAADCEFEGEEGFEADLMKATSIPDKAVAERRLRSVIARAPAGRDAFMIAMAAARLGLVDLSLDWLERAYELHTPDLVSIGIEPDIEPLRREARYRALVKKMGLEE